MFKNLLKFNNLITFEITNSIDGMIYELSENVKIELKNYIKQK